MSLASHSLSFLYHAVVGAGLEACTGVACGGSLMPHVTPPGGCLTSPGMRMWASLGSVQMKMGLLLWAGWLQGSLMDIDAHLFSMKLLGIMLPLFSTRTKRSTTWTAKGCSCSGWLFTASSPVGVGSSQVSMQSLSQGLTCCSTGGQAGAPQMEASGAQHRLQQGSRAEPSMLLSAAHTTAHPARQGLLSSLPGARQKPVHPPQGAGQTVPLAADVKLPTTCMPTPTRC